ncbi:MAG: adenylate/guanylate cyclase domain-containing protein [Alphaproteobacteria bacterium]|jgi:class 3 adenylate cyclase/DNA-binding transcriptional MerR regulator|nr:adenylate/guanylate cyclase domain-containing protein [Alphaproteobacteria bacterium]
MLTSREVMARTGISRATLNNYIALGILPRPIVGVAGPGAGSVRRIGYFEDEVVERIQEVQQLKRQGLAMTDIATRFSGEVETSDRAAAANGEDDVMEYTSHEERRRAAAPSVITPGRPLRLTIEDIPHPAYMVNNNFELEWWNTQATIEIFHHREGLGRESEARNVFRLLLEAQEASEGAEWMEALRLHLGVAKNRVGAAELAKLAPEIGAENVGLLNTIYEETEAIQKRHIVRAPVQLQNEIGDLVAYDLFATFSREGVLFAYVPRGDEADSLLDFLSRREQVIRDLLTKRQPVLTHLAVLVADLENSAQLATELPAEEYFAFVNDVWGSMEPVFRSYYGTHGKHLSDGLVYYFFPQPDCNYVMNAIECARELKEAMRRISREWQLKRNLLSEFRLNIGLNEGHDWFGSFNTTAAIELTVLGDTADQARGLARLARDGAIMATKSMLGILGPEERARIHFGVRRRDATGNEILVPTIYSRVANMIEPETLQESRGVDLGQLVVAEISDVFDGEMLARLR